MGYFFAKSKVAHLNGNASLSKRNMFLSILMPTILHTLYDAIIMYAVSVESGLFVILFFVFDIAMVILCFNIVKKTSTVQQNLTKEIQSGAIVSTPTGQISYQQPSTQSFNFCPICGRNVKGYNFCPSCGFKTH